ERAFGDAQCERRGPPWPNRRFGGSDREETNERQQGERARRDEGPETAPAVDSTHGVRVDPWPDGRWNEPEGQDQPLLVEPGADGDALIQHEEPKQTIHDGGLHHDDPFAAIVCPHPRQKRTSTQSDSGQLSTTRRTSRASMRSKRR